MFIILQYGNKIHIIEILSFIKLIDSFNNQNKYFTVYSSIILTIQIVLVACRSNQRLVFVNQEFPAVVHNHSSALRLEIQKHVTFLYTTQIQTDLCVIFPSSVNIC